MRELSGEQQTEREWDPDVSAGDAPQARAAWLRYIFAALCISGLGLVVAASVGLTTKAQTTESGLTALPETSSAVRRGFREEAVDQQDWCTRRIR